MIILKTILTAQTFSFIPRSQTYNKLYLTNETNNTTVEVTIDIDTAGEYYNTITADYTLIENTFYKLEIKNNTDIVFVGKVFCTDQVIADFTTNETTYTPNTAVNEFIVL